MNQNVETFLTVNASKFTQSDLAILKQKMENLDPSRLTVIQSVELKDPTTLLIISILIGGLGVDRFMLEDTGMGVLKLLTAGLCGILTIIDWFTVSDRTRKYNFNKIMLHL